MVYFWITVGILDVFILLFLALIIKTSLRRTPVDIRTRKLSEDHPMKKIQQDILEDQRFFKEHIGELIVIEANGVGLAAKRYTQPNPKGRILLFHGYRSIAETDFACVMQPYFDQGYELILIDQRAHGKSSGSWIGFGVLERYDCLSWIRFLNHEYGNLPTFLSGISMGSTTVLMALGLELPSNVKGVIADCGFTSPKEILLHVLARKHLPAKLLLPGLELFSRIFAGYSLSKYSTIDALKSNSIPVLFIHGQEDHYVPISMTMRNFDACIAEKELLLVEGAGHGTSYLQDRKGVEKAVFSFLQTHNR
ncbi:MAG: alpha/beta fold hydrolase [Clostridia bacterium]|nr:alpha/beta fold hydrolase [Clostridia bacterium]